MPTPQPNEGVTLRRDYTSLAADYDRDRFLGPKGTFLYRTDRQIVRDLVLASKASVVLDVPSGTGRVLEYLAGMPLRVVGADLTRAMLKNALRKAVGEPRLLLQTDAARLPFGCAIFDCVITLRFFHLFSPATRMEFVREFSRVLKPGGYLICSFTNGWYAFGLNWLRKCLGWPTTSFLFPGELRRLFPGWEVCALRGNYWPFQWRVASKSHALEKLLIWLNGKPPLNRVCWERFYLLRKPHEV